MNAKNVWGHVLGLVAAMSAVACASAPSQPDEVLGKTSSALEETLSCTSTVRSGSVVGPILYTLTDPDVKVQRQPDTSGGIATQGHLLITSQVFTTNYGIQENGSIRLSSTPKVSPQPVVLGFEAVSDTYIRDGAPNQNQGALETLRIQQSGKNRALVRFAHPNLAADLPGGVASALLGLSIVVNGENWGASGRATRFTG
jgi:hypothetical protein